MNDLELEERVAELRGRGLTPKQIARTLGVRPADVAPLVRRVAPPARTTAPLVGCWINAGWSAGLTWTSFPEWLDPGSRGTGFVQVLVAREHRYGKVDICGYLVDVYCLGVKDVLRRVIEPDEVAAFVHERYAIFGARALPAPVELAQHLVLGAVEYARGLGFDPHRDFAACRDHLGTWVGASSIQFGEHGRPAYYAGPHDDRLRILRTLRASVGEGNFEYVMFE